MNGLALLLSCSALLPGSCPSVDEPWKPDVGAAITYVGTRSGNGPDREYANRTLRGVFSRLLRGL